MKAYISFYNENSFNNIFKSDSQNAYKSIADFWSRELISFKTTDLIELKYINALIFTNLSSSISRYIDKKQRNTFDRQVANFRCFVSDLSRKDDFIKAYVGDLDCDVNDSSMNREDHTPILNLKDETLLFKSLFEVSKIIIVGEDGVLSFDNEAVFNDYFNDLIDLLFELKNNSFDFKTHLNEIDEYLIKIFNDGEISEPNSFKNIIKIKVLNENIDGNILKPSLSTRIVKRFNPCSKKTKPKNKDKLTFDDLIIESGKNESGSRLKNYIIEFSIIILIILSVLGYFFKLSTINDNAENKIETEYSYETSSGSEKTNITIERVSSE